MLFHKQVVKDNGMKRVKFIGNNFSPSKEGQESPDCYSTPVHFKQHKGGSDFLGIDPSLKKG